MSKGNKGNKKHRDGASSSSSSAHGGGKGNKKDKKNKMDDDDLLKLYRQFIDQIRYGNGHAGDHLVSTGKINGESFVNLFAKEHNLDPSQRSIVQKFDKDIRK